MNQTDTLDYLLIMIMHMESLVTAAVHAGYLRSISRNLFFTLMTLDLVFNAGITPMLGGWSPGYLGRFLVRRVFSYFAAFTLWNYYHEYVPVLFDSMGKAGTAIMGQPIDAGYAISPGRIWEQGVVVAMQFQKLHLTNILGMFGGAGFFYPMFFAILLAFGGLAVLATMVRLELLLALLAGYPLLAFGGHPITKPLAAGYIRWIFGLSVRVFLFVLLGTFAARLSEVFLLEAERDVRWTTSWLITLAPLPAFLVLSMLAFSVNRVASQLTSGLNWHPGPWEIAPGLKEEQ